MPHSEHLPKLLKRAAAALMPKDQPQPDLSADADVAPDQDADQNEAAHDR